MIRERIESVLNERVEGPVLGTGLIRTVSGNTYFLKMGSASAAFLCEANGLRELAKSGEIRTVRMVSAGEDYILTEYLQSRPPKEGFFEKFGRQLARMHRYTGEKFGFFEDNFIGKNPQPNIPIGEEAMDWTAFFWNKRLLFQYRLAEKNGCASAVLSRAFVRLEAKIGTFFAGSEEPPALLHGDLWAGNFLCDGRNRAVLIDPAVYYGHREADLVLTKLFGGFNRAFYRAYREEYPLPEGWERRENFYLLYHVMNHLNLFGTAYLRQAEYLATSF